MGTLFDGALYGFFRGAGLGLYPAYAISGLGEGSGGERTAMAAILTVFFEIVGAVGGAIQAAIAK